MPFWKSLLIDLSWIVIYFLLYHFLGFESTVIMALALILSDLVKKEYPKKPKLPPTTTYRYKQGGKVRF